MKINLRMAAASGGLALIMATTASAETVSQAEGPCSINTIRGTYAFEMRGQSFGGGLPA
jgi:hypothetical protein